MSDYVVPTDEALAAYAKGMEEGKPEADCQQAAYLASPYDSVEASNFDAIAAECVYEMEKQREQAERAWVTLWNALDNAETYIATTARDSLLHQTVYGALTAHNPGADLFSRYDRHADEEESQ